MNCTETSRLFDAHADGELTLTESIAVDEHLSVCARCKGSLAALQAVRAAIVRHADTPPTPQELRRALERGDRRPATGGMSAWLRSPLAVATPGLLALIVVGWFVLAGPAPQPAVTRSVVYHIANSNTAGAALRSLSNHLNAAPSTKVVVVAHSSGVDFLLRGSRDEADQPFEVAVREFNRRGVEFRVCYNTLERRGISAAQVVPGATLVPSGIAEIGRLQGKEGYAYMRL